MPIFPPPTSPEQDVLWLHEIWDACGSLCRHLQDAEKALTIGRDSIGTSQERVARSARTCAAAREAVARASRRTQRANDAATIRAKMDSRILPRERPDKVFAGYGDAQPCTGCADPILPVQVAWTLRNSREVTHRFHVVCFGLWDAELSRRGIRRGA